jgi:hypothetical protein
MELVRLGNIFVSLFESSCQLVFHKDVSETFPVFNSFVHRNFQYLYTSLMNDRE